MRLVFYLKKKLPPEQVMTCKNFRWGDYSWVLQGYQMFSPLGVDCTLVHDLPEQGLVIGFRDDLTNHISPTAKRFLVCFEGERSTHPWTNIDIVQSPCKAVTTMGKTRLYLPHFPQPNLVPRARERGDVCENIRFYGLTMNLDERLRDDSFRAWLADNGLRLDIVEDEKKWHDYTDTDLVLAIRKLGELVDNKPPSKLWNSWRAGVPAVLGPEDSFRFYRKSELDFIETATLDDVKKAILHLKKNPERRRQMAENGLERAKEITPDRVCQIWKKAFEEQIIPLAEEWFRSPVTRRLFFLRRQTSIQLRRIKHATPFLKNVPIKDILLYRQRKH